jgi:site-specific DNA recombinase
MASLAQLESQSLSQNIKLGLHYRFQNGEVRGNYSRFLGYTKDEEGNLVIESAEAEVVKRIYREYMEGSSLLQIGRGWKQTEFSPGRGKRSGVRKH